jgi:hypothetical protein
VKTPKGTSVGVDDPYATVERCDHLTDRGACRIPIERPQLDPVFTAERRADDLRCPAADPHGEWEWADCPQFCARQRSRECVRCALPERRLPGDERPLLEEHHLSYSDEPESAMDHEITVYLCRWCHAKVHGSWARIDDDVSPDTEALAVAEGRRSRELDETGFQTAAERYDEEE